MAFHVGETLNEKKMLKSYLQSIYAPEKKADFDFDDYGYSEHEMEERTKEKPSNTNNTSELENNNGETMMYMVNKLNQNKEEEK